MTLPLHVENRAAVEHAGRILKLGGLVALPAGSSYQVMADASNVQALQRAFAASTASPQTPVWVYVSSGEALADWAVAYPSAAAAAFDHFAPESLTLVLHRHPHVTPLVTGGGHSIWLQRPSVSYIATLTQRFHLGLVVLEGRGKPADYAIELELHVPPSAPQPESTVVDYQAEQAQVVVEGAVSITDLQPYLQGHEKASAS